VSISERRKSRVETQPIVSKTQRTQRRPVEAAMLHGHPFRVNAAELARRKFLHLTAGAAALPAMSGDVKAQTYPSRPITIIDTYAAGSPTDTSARILVEPMRRSLAQPIVIENVAGADGNIGTGRAARARADGHTLIVGTLSTHVLNGAFYSLPYDVLNVFIPISPLATAPFILCTKKTIPAKDLNELIEWLKANPSKASAAIGASTIRLLAMFFQRETRTQFALVPYRGGPPAVQDLMADQIDFSFLTPDFLPLVRAGSIRAFAVTSDTRLALARDIPTFAEMGLPSLSFSTWLGLFAPKGTPREVVSKLNAAVVEALADPAVRSRRS
jgi:tripartite-type tricarboxylate transporter receptor subunit TctC